MYYKSSVHARQDDPIQLLTNAIYHCLYGPDSLRTFSRFPTVEDVDACEILEGLRRKVDDER